MEVVMQVGVNGLTLAAVYSLVALGLALVYGTLHVPNFAHGAFYAAGAFLAWWLAHRMGWPWVAVAPAAAVLVALLATVCERCVFRPLQAWTGLRPMIASLGLLLFLEAAIQGIWGADFRALASPWPGVWSMGGVHVPIQRWVLLLTTGGLLSVMHVFLVHSATGQALVAVAEDRAGAALVGIDPQRMTTLAFALSGAMAAVAAFLYAPLTVVHPTMGDLVITKAFVLVLLGGRAQVPGIVTMALLLGMTEALAGHLLPSARQEVVAFAVLVLVLSWRPTGVLTAGRSRWAMPPS